MAFITILLGVLKFVGNLASLVFKTAVSWAEGTQVGTLIKTDLQKLGAMAAVYAVELSFILVPLLGLKAVVVVPIAVVAVLVPNVVSQFITGSK